jgi:GTP cyclohydrolase I
VTSGPEYQPNPEDLVSRSEETFVSWNADTVRAVLSDLEAWHRTPEDHRAKTPERFLKMLWQLTHREEFTFTTFEARGNEMITLGPIPFYTMCAHHTAPFFGTVYIGYVPDKSIAGLSKFPRAVKYLAKGFWVQEELTTAIADYLEEKLEPLGVAVVVKAEHLCMAMRGVEQPGVETITSAMKGVFGDHDRTAKAEFMSLIQGTGL